MTNWSYGNSLLVPTGLTYTQRVGAALVAFIEFYDYIHGDHNIKASELDVNMRASRADTAVALSIEHQRAMIALIGTHRRRTYAHDLVYGLHVLYRLFGRPWNAATEGNEHAHQDMKRFFLHLACHSSKHSGDCLQVLRLLTVKQQTLRLHAARVLPTSNYAAMRANAVLGRESGEEGMCEKGGVKAGPKGLKMYAERDAKMLATRDMVRETMCSPCEVE